MTRGRKDRAGAGWLALPALPIVCWVGHAALLALAAGSLTAGAAVGSALLAAAGIALIAAAAVAVQWFFHSRPASSPSR